MNFLKRELAPISSEAWPQIEEEVQRALKANLTARRVVDFDGPKGFELSAVNLGRLSEVRESESGVHYGVRKVQPLIEVRVPFSLDVWELDNAARGSEDVDLAPAVDAALELAGFEEAAVYRGFSPGAIQGLSKASEHEPVPLGDNSQGYVDAAARGIIELNDRGVAGPYALVLGADAFKRLSADVSSYPPRQRIARMIEGPILHSRALEGGLLVSQRGGDFSLTVGQDISLGYDKHDSKTVSLYLTETFTFQVHGPEAVVAFSP